MTKNEVLEIVRKEISSILKNNLHEFEDHLFENPFKPLQGQTLKPEDSIDLLHISVRASTVLHNRGIETIGQLSNVTKYELLRYRNVGKKCAWEIRLAMCRNGYDLK